MKRQNLKSKSGTLFVLDLPSDLTEILDRRAAAAKVDSTSYLCGIIAAGLRTVTLAVELKNETWDEVDRLAFAEGLTRSEYVTKAVMHLAESQPLPA